MERGPRQEQQDIAPERTPERASESRREIVEAKRVTDALEGAMSSIDAPSFGIDESVDVIGRAAHVARLPADETGPIVEEAERSLDRIVRDMSAERNNAKASVYAAVERRMKRSPLVKTAIVSALLHIPLTPAVKDLYGHLFPEKPDTVLRPQSYEDMLAKSAHAAERKDRIVPERLETYKAEIRDQLDSGKNITLRDLYLTMEEKNGVEPDRVERAKKKAEELSDAYAERFGGDIDRPKLVQFVTEMFGDPSNHVWGQGSVTEYLETGKHNCVAIAKAEAIVLEGVIDRLPPEAQAKYQLGINKLKRHEIATISVTGAEGFTTYMLEGDVPELHNEIEGVGTKTIALNVLKQGIVAEKPLVFAAKSGNVEKSPKLITVGDQPVDDGVEVTGPLSGDAYMVQQAARQGVKPEVVKVPDNINDAIEFEVLSGEQGAEILKEATERLERMSKYGGGTTLLELFKLEHPLPEDVRAAEPSEGLLPSFDRIEAGAVKWWNAEAIDALLDSRIPELVIAPTVEMLPGDRSLVFRIPENLIEGLRVHQNDRKRPVRFRELTINTASMEMTVVGVYIGQVRSLLEAAKDIPRVNLDIPIFEDPELVNVLMEAPQKEIRVTRGIFSSMNIIPLGETGKTLFLDAYEYLALIKDIPEALKYPNIRWDGDMGISAVGELAAVLRTKLPPNDPRRLDAERAAKEQQTSSQPRPTSEHPYAHNAEGVVDLRNERILAPEFAQRLRDTKTRLIVLGSGSDGSIDTLALQTIKSSALPSDVRIRVVGNTLSPEAATEISNLGTPNVEYDLKSYTKASFDAMQGFLTFKNLHYDDAHPEEKSLLDELITSILPDPESDTYLPTATTWTIPLGAYINALKRYPMLPLVNIYPGFD